MPTANALNKIKPLDYIVRIIAVPMENHACTSSLCARECIDPCAGTMTLE
jgi:hypothetical protein